MHITEPDTLADLIADCAAIPAQPGPAEQTLPHAATPWTVDEACYAQVSELDEYI